MLVYFLKHENIETCTLVHRLNDFLSLASNCVWKMMFYVLNAGGRAFGQHQRACTCTRASTLDSRGEEDTVGALHCERNSGKLNCRFLFLFSAVVYYLIIVLVILWIISTSTSFFLRALYQHNPDFFFKFRRLWTSANCTK